MPLRMKAVPFFGSTPRRALNPMQRSALVDGLRPLLVSIWPDDLLLLLALRMPILDALTREQLVEAIVHLRKYRGLMRRLPVSELEGVVAEVRPDLFAVINRDGGRVWLAAQLNDLKELAAA